MMTIPTKLDKGAVGLWAWPGLLLQQFTLRPAGCNLLEHRGTGYEIWKKPSGTIPRKPISYWCQNRFLLLIQGHASRLPLHLVSEGQLQYR
jgi:hypothetical protein